MKFNKILFHLGHPAHFHLFKNFIKRISQNKEVLIITKHKDVLSNLLSESGFEYINIFNKRRRKDYIGIVSSNFSQLLSILKYSIKKRPDIFFGTSALTPIIGKFLNIPSVTLNEDDYHTVPMLANTAFPYSSYILAPDCCDMGQWTEKTTFHSSYHELAYLHPEVFKPNRKIVDKYFNSNQRYFILRLSSLDAHHDNDISGLQDDKVIDIVRTLEPYGKVIINSERKFKRKVLRKNVINFQPLDFHHILNYSSIVISDSQTVSAEAGVLGVPFIRYNDFVDRIGYLKELEEKYSLGYGIHPPNSDKIIERINYLLKIESMQSLFHKRKQGMIKDKINFTNFLVDFLNKLEKNGKFNK